MPSAGARSYGPIWYTAVPSPGVEHPDHGREIYRLDVLDDLGRFWRVTVLLDMRALARVINRASREGGTVRSGAFTVHVKKRPGEPVPTDSPYRQ